MATININFVDDLLIVSVTGELTAQEVIGVVEEYYPNEIVRDVIWNLTNGSLSAISTQGFKAIAAATLITMANGARKGGKTAFVGTNAAEYGLMRMYSAIAEMTGVPVKYSVFKTIEEAQQWL